MMVWGTAVPLLKAAIPFFVYSSLYANSLGILKAHERDCAGAVLVRGVARG